MGIRLLVTAGFPLLVTLMARMPSSEPCILWLIDYYTVRPAGRAARIMSVFSVAQMYINVKACKFPSVQSIKTSSSARSCLAVML